jgi:hypothetical protein
MSTSWADGARLCLTWRRERLPAALWVPVAATVTLASTLPLDLTDAWGVALIRVVTAWLALAGMRLWDDLADLPHDRVHHPERVLSRSTETAPAWIASVTTLYLCPGLVAAGQGRVAVFTGLVFALSVLYAANLHTRPAGAWLRLLKYPALVVALGGGLAPLDLLALALVYLGVCHDELLQEVDAPRGPRAAVAALDALGVFGWAAIWWGQGAPSTALLVTASLMAAVLAGTLLMRVRGAWLHAVRACLLLGTVLLFALPQTIPAC